MASSKSYVIILMVLSIGLLCSTPSKAQKYPPIVPGLSFDFYETSCPNLENIVRNYLENAIKNDIGLAAGLLRLHFHDCFVQGCDGSILLDGTASNPSEKSAPPNLSLRATAFKAINDLKDLITQAGCGKVVSCADLAAIAARDSVYKSGGPNYKVLLGRRDGLTFANSTEVLRFLPSPNSNVSVLLAALSLNNLDVNDLVTLSGGHTIGIGHCTSFQARLFPTQDPTLGKYFAAGLYRTCPVLDTVNTTVLDIRTPNKFDNKYYLDLLNKEGLFTSDQDMNIDSRTKPIVNSFALNQTLFFEKFVYSMTKMGELKVLTGNQGEIRANCSVVNSPSKLFSMVDGEVSEGYVEAF